MTYINFCVNNLVDKICSNVCDISHMKNICLYIAKIYLNTHPPHSQNKIEILRKHNLCCVFETEESYTTLFSHNLYDIAKISETCASGTFCLISVQVVMGLNDLEK